MLRRANFHLKQAKHQHLLVLRVPNRRVPSALLMGFRRTQTKLWPCWPRAIRQRQIVKLTKCSLLRLHVLNKKRFQLKFNLLDLFYTCTVNLVLTNQGLFWLGQAFINIFKQSFTLCNQGGLIFSELLYCRSLIVFLLLFFPIVSVFIFMTDLLVADHTYALLVI